MSFIDIGLISMFIFGVVGVIFGYISMRREDKIEKDPEIKPEPECDHDWETISYGDVFRDEYIYHSHLLMAASLISMDHYDYYVKPTHGEIMFILNRFPNVTTTQSVNKVCIKCGECDNQEAKWLKILKDKKKADRRRKMWAKQLWEDGCKK